MNLSEIKKKLEFTRDRSIAGLMLLEAENISGDLDGINILDMVDGSLFFQLISLYSAQSKAPLVEKFIASKFGYKLVSSSKGRGDFYDPVTDEYIELKASFTNKGKNLNIRQIRPWQDIHKYLLMYIDEDNPKDSVLFILNKQQMNEEIQLLGSHTHGTKEANKSNLNHEFSITIPVNADNLLYQRWYNNYSDVKALGTILSKA